MVALGQRRTLPLGIQKCMGDQLKDYGTLGFRPESLQVAENAAVQGEIVAVEPPGAETIARLRLPELEREVLLRAGRHGAFALGEWLGLRAPAAALHLFNTAGTRITRPEEGT